MNQQQFAHAQEKLTVLPPLLTIAEVRQRLNISASTLERLIRNKELPILRIAGCRRIDPVDLERYEKRSRGSKK